MRFKGSVPVSLTWNGISLNADLLEANPVVNPEDRKPIPGIVDSSVTLTLKYEPAIKPVKAKRKLRRSKAPEIEIDHEEGSEI